VTLQLLQVFVASLQADDRHHFIAAGFGLWLQGFQQEMSRQQVMLPDLCHPACTTGPIVKSPAVQASDCRSVGL
jgi:hypothetical protein